MKLCGSVNWCKIGWLVVVINLLLSVSVAYAQNLPPVLDRGIPNQHAEVGSDFSYTIPGNAFKDIDDAQRTYTVLPSSMPSWLTFDGKRFSGTPSSTGSSSIEVTATDAAGNFSKTSFSIIVNPNDQPYAAFTMDAQQGCNSLYVQFENKSSGSGSFLFHWDFGNGNTSSLPNPVANYTEPGTYTVTLTITNLPGLSYSDIVTVYPSPVASIGPVANGCEPLGVTLTSTGNAGEYYTWYSEKFPGQHQRNTILNTLQLDTLQNGVYNVDLSVTDANGCVGMKNTPNLFEVYDKPIASFTFQKENNCQPSLTTFTPTSQIEGSQITGHEWRVGGVLQGAGDPFTYNFTTAGSYEVSLVETSEFGCKSEIFNDTVVFNNGNSATFSFLPGVTCLGKSTSFISSASPGVPSYAWNFNNEGTSDIENPSWKFNSSGQKPVNLSVSFSDGCVIDISKDVPVEELKADFSYSSTGVCTDDFTVSFSDQSSATVGTIISRNWFRDGVPFSTPSLQLAAGTYEIRLEVTGSAGCTAMVAKTITLAYSSPSILITGASLGCVGSETNLTAQFNSSYDSPTDYSWDFGDGSPVDVSGASVSHTYGLGTFTVQLTVTTANSCSYTATKTNAVHFVNPPVISSFNLTQSDSCLNTTVSPTVTYSLGTDQLVFTIPTPAPGVTETITDIDPTSYTYNHPFENIGTYSIEVVAYDNGCPSGTTTISGIQINGPKALFNPAQTTFCNNPPYDASFQNKTLNNTTGIRYDWDFGDGGTLTTKTNSDVTHQYNTIGNFRVSLTATDTISISGCSDTHYEEISVFSFNNARGIISASDTSGCTPDSVNFSQNIISRLSPNYVVKAYEWDFNNDGIPDASTTEASIQHTYTVPGIYSVGLKVIGESGCDYSFTENNLIHANGPAVNFNYSPSPVCSGSPVTFTNQSAKNPVGSSFTSFSWNFGDGITSGLENPTYNYSANDTFNVSLTITDSNRCTSTLEKKKLISIQPLEAAFVADPVVACSGSTVTFKNNSSGTNLTNYWNFGDGTPVISNTDLNNISHTYSTYGTYTASLNVTTGGCSKTVTQSLNIINATAGFKVDTSMTGCAPTFASFTPFADNNDVVSYFWSFGDNTTSRERAPLHKYYTPGKYDVSLQVEFKGGCIRNNTIKNCVFVKGAYGELNYDATPACAPNEVTFSLSNMFSVDSIRWDFGNGVGNSYKVTGYPTSLQELYTYTSVGFTKPSVVLSSSVCSSSYAYEKNSAGNDDPVRIYTSVPPKAGFTVDKNNICEGIPINFTDTSLKVDDLYPAKFWKWGFADGATDTTQNPRHAYNNIGDFKPQLIISNQLGCSDTVTGSVFILNRANVHSNIVKPGNDNFLVCPGTDIDFRGSASTGNGGSIVSWKWVFGEGDTTFVENTAQPGDTISYITTKHTFDKSLRGQNKEVILIATDDKLCSNSTFRTVDINSLQAALDYRPQPAYRGGSVDFIDQTVTAPGFPVKKWSWFFDGGNPDSDTGKNPQNIVFNDIRSYNVTLDVSDESGCTDGTTFSLPVLNNPPVITSFDVNILVNTSYQFTLEEFELYFDAKDPDQSLNQMQIIELPTRGILKLNNIPVSVNQVISYSEISNLTYSSDSEGSDAITWNASDGTNYSNVAAVNIQVLPEPEPPILNDLVFNIKEDSVINFDLKILRDKNYFDNPTLPGFSLKELNILTIPNLSQGSLKLNNSNGVSAGQLFSTTQIDNDFFTVTPVTGYDGSISIDWNGFDGYKWGTAPAKIIINYINSIPVLTNIERLNQKEDAVQTILIDEFRRNYFDSDINDNFTTFFLDVPSGLQGTFKINNNPAVAGMNSIPIDQLDSVTFTPGKGFDGLIEVQWGASDGQDTGNALIRFSFVNTPPVAHDFNVSGTEDNIFKFHSSDFESRPPFEDKDQYDKLGVVSIETLPEHGTLVHINDVAIQAHYSIAAGSINLQLKFIPDPNWFGTTSFIYKSTDGTDWSVNEATVWINIESVNDAPIALNDADTIFEDQILTGFDVTANDADVDDVRDSLRVSIADAGTAGVHGKITLNSDGKLKYEPMQNFNGTVSFTYRICDTSDSCSIATVTIYIVPVNDPPSAVNDTITIFDDTKFYSSVDTTNLLHNDSDPEGDSIYVSKVENGFPGDTILGNSGKIIVQNDGNYIYFPDSAKVISLNENQVFIDSFQYVVSDFPEGLFSSARLLIRIKGLNTPPVASNDTIWVVENQIIDFNTDSTLLTNDVDPEGSPLRITAIDSDSTGLIISSSGILEWKTDGEFKYRQGEKNALFDYLSEGETAKVEFSYTVSDGKKNSNAKLVIIINGKNDRPIAINDVNSIIEKTDSIVSDSSSYLLVNDSDIDRGDSIFITKVNQDPSAWINGIYGMLHWQGDGLYTYYIIREATDSLYNGEKVEDKFAYLLSDRLGATSTGILTITITGVDDIPNTVNDTLRMFEDDQTGSLRAGVNGLLDGDIDIDGDLLKVTEINYSDQKTFGTRYGTITWDELGNIDFIIDSDAVDPLKMGEIVTDSVRYIAEDPSGGASSAQLIIIITGENDNPVALNDSVTINEDTEFVSATIADSTSLIWNDYDIEGDLIFVSLVNELPADSIIRGGYGNLQWDSTGTFTYYTNRKITDTLAFGETGFDEFKYTLADTLGGTGSASLIIEITGINDPPEAVPDSSATEDIIPIIAASTDTIQVLYNDYDVDGHKRILTSVNGDSINTTKNGKYGILSWHPDGSYEYQPDTAFAESLRPMVQVTDTFTYKIKDEFLASDTTLLQLTIVGINNAPIARNDTLKNVLEDYIYTSLPLGLLIPKNVLDADRDTLKVIKMNGSIHDSIPGDLGYGYIKWDSLGKVGFSPYQSVIHQLGYGEYVTETFTYTVSDKEYPARAKLIVNILGENDSVFAIDDTLRLEEDSYGRENVVLNDKDIDNDGKGNFDYASLSIVDNFGPFHGKASRNSVTGEIYYMPEKDFNGKDSLKYSICDTGYPVYCSEAWLYINVTPVNDPPVATNFVLETPMNTPVGFDYLKQVSDVDDGVDQKSLDSIKGNPRLQKIGNTITYTPVKDYTGIDEFTYLLKDFSGASAYVIVTVIVGDTLSDFRAQNDSDSTREDAPVDINVLANDTLGSEFPDPRSVEIKVLPINGVAVFDPVNQVVNYQPDKDFNGSDSLEYIVSSGTGNWSFAKVLITVTPVNDQIVANDDFAETYIDTPVNISVLANDFDPEYMIDTANFQILHNPRFGNPNFSYTTGKLSYKPNLGFKGVDTLVYKICDLDTNASCDSALVIILVKSEHSGFSAENDNYITNENLPHPMVKPLPIDNDKNTVDPEILVAPETFSIISGPSYGSFTSSNGIVTYIPETNYFGPDWMQYIVSDSAGNWDMAEINIWVNEVNTPPVAVNDTFIVTKNEFKRLFVLANDYDIDGTLNWSRLDTVFRKGPRNGKIQIDKNTGTILYKPSINKGNDQFTYRIYDNKGSFDEATVYVTIDLETTIYIRLNTNEDTPVSIDIAPELIKYNLTFSISKVIEELKPDLGDYSFTNNNSEFIYTPLPDITGKDTIWLNVWSEDNSQFANLRIFINIIPVNDAPDAIDDTIHWINILAAKVITFDSLLVNDFDIDGDSIRFTRFIQKGYPELNISIDSINSTITISTDSIRWCDAWFSYEISDGILTDTAKVYIWPELNGIVANNDRDTLNENSSKNINVLANDLFKDNQRCTIDTTIITIQPKHGTAIGTYDNFVNYTPACHYYGFDSLQYKIIDIWGQSSSAWVNIEVFRRNTPPVAADDDTISAFGSVINIPVLNNDYDPDASVSPDCPGDPNAFIDSVKTHVVMGYEPTFGSVEFDQSTFSFIYTPDTTNCESVTFRYTIFDNEGDSATATVTIEFNEAPAYANTDLVKTYPGVSKEIDPLLNDAGYFIPDLTEFTQSYSLHGNVTWNSDNIVTYTPDKGFIGRDSILYTIVSPCGNEQSAYIIFIVEKLRVPEIITPNGDGKNDVLIIDGIEYFPDNLFEIFNRYGHVVYQKKGYLNEWGGYSNKGSLGGNKPLPAGTYYYTLIYNEGRNRQAGFIYIFW